MTVATEPPKPPDEKSLPPPSPWRVRSLLMVPMAVLVALLVWYARLPSRNLSLPTGCIPAEGANTIDDRGLVYYDRILKKVGNHEVRFRLVKKMRATDPDTFYMMDNKVWNGLFAYFAEQRPDDVRNNEWQDGAHAPRTIPSVAEGVTTPAEDENFVNFRAADNPRLPVVSVAVEDAHRFALWLGGRLPGVDEWDKAAGMYDSDGEGPYMQAWDENSKDQIAVNRPYKGPMKVGTAPMDISPFGLRDMAGNGREWTRDLHATGHIPLPKPATKDMVMTRGNSHLSRQPLSYDDLEHGSGGVGKPEGTVYLETEPTLGFRVVLDPEP